MLKNNKILIRDGVFETNSSSMHTLVLSEKKEYASDTDFNDCIEAANEMEKNLHNNGYFLGQSAKYYPIPSFTDSDFYFGSSFNIISNWEDKMVYVLALPKNYNEQIELIEEICNKIKGIDGIITTISPDMEDLEDERINDLLIMPRGSLIGDSFGGVSYEGVNAIDNAISILKKSEIFKNSSTIDIYLEIIFCNKYVIITDSDECNNFYHGYLKGYFEESGFTHVLAYEYNDEFGVQYSFKPIDEYINSYYS